jgi:hypothetical protein
MKSDESWVVATLKGYPANEICYLVGYSYRYRSTKKSDYPARYPCFYSSMFFLPLQPNTHCWKVLHDLSAKDRKNTLEWIEQVPEKT